MEIILISILSALAVIGLALTVDTSTVVFDPISVPPQWQNLGYTSNVVSSRLTDQILRMNEEADSHKRGRGVQLGSQKTVTHELGSYLGLAAPIWILRKEMGLIKVTVGGEIVLVDQKSKSYQFLMRSTTNSTTVFTSTECGSDTHPDVLIGLAAEEALRVIDPYILAAYYFEREENAYYAAQGDESPEDESKSPVEEGGEKIDVDNTCGSTPHDKLGAFHNTLWTIQNSVKISSKDNRKWYYDLWGMVHMVKKEYDLAIGKFKNALAIDPKFAIAIHNWGIALAAQGRYRDAIAKYQEAVAAGSTMPGIYNHWAFALGKLGYSEEAIDAFHIALKIDPDYADAYHKLGELYEGLGQTRMANDNYKKAVVLDPTGKGFRESFERTDNWKY
jgi:hypothetical protein